MQVQNPTNQSKLCPSLGENLEAFQVRDVPEGFERCEGCQCIVSGATFPTERLVKGEWPEAPSEPESGE